MHPLTSSFSLGLAASLAAISVTALWLSPCQADGPPGNLAELRARGPAGLDALLADYRAVATHSPASDERWDAAIDAVAAQRYARASGLYWYTDLTLAEGEAQRMHRPILALRMLGDLRDDLSCANSRLFRATLYANTEVADFLRSHFVLYWSSERAVPTVTIDFGDGRKLVRTTTGNSAHYVLDEQGHVLDVLPGLYAPAVFRAELTASLALADQVRGQPDAERLQATLAYHSAAIAATDRTWQRVVGADYIRRSPYLLSSTALARAQRATASKAIIEVPDLAAIEAVQPGEVPDDSAAWSAIGQRVWNIHDAAPVDRAAVGAAHQAPLAPPAAMVLDEASRALIAAIRNHGPLGVDPTKLVAETRQVIARLAQHIVADTALNQFTLRQAIRRHIVDRRETDFAALNGWVYAEVFATPSTDPWLGLLPRTDFTGVPGDGVVMR